MSELFLNYWWQLILVAIASYLLGGVNFAILFSKIIKHEDIRSVGSGNAGTTNVFRVFGLRMGTLTFVCDALKGVVACLACKFIFRFTQTEISFEYWAGIFVVLGHVFPVFHQLRGGKGVATSIGVCSVTHPILMLCCAPVMLLIVFVIDRMSVMSLLFAIFMTVFHWTVLREEVGIASCVFLTVMFSLVTFAHRHNIVRIFTGKELRTGVRRKILRQDKREARLQRQQELISQQQTESDGEQQEEKSTSNEETK